MGVEKHSEHSFACSARPRIGSNVNIFNLCVFVVVVFLHSDGNDLCVALTNHRLPMYICTWVCA